MFMLCARISSKLFPRWYLLCAGSSNGECKVISLAENRAAICTHVRKCADAAILPAERLGAIFRIRTVGVKVVLAHFTDIAYRAAVRASFSFE